MIVLESDEDLGLGWIMHKYTVVTTRYTAPPFVIRVRGRVDSSLSFMAEGDGTFRVEIENNLLTRLMKPRCLIQKFDPLGNAYTFPRQVTALQVVDRIVLRSWSPRASSKV